MVKDLPGFAPHHFHHRRPVHTLVDQTISPVDVDDVASIRYRQPTCVNGASELGFVFNTLQVKQVMEKFEYVAIFPGVDIGGSAVSDWLI